MALQEWRSPSHRIWPWFHDAERDVLYCQNYQELKVYILLIKQTTRTGILYIYLSKVNIIPTNVKPISISSITNDVVSVKGEGPPLPTLRTTPPPILGVANEQRWGVDVGLCIQQIDQYKLDDDSTGTRYSYPSDRRILLT
jgi:hypothetical protein